jgi:acetate kinase
MDDPTEHVILTLNSGSSSVKFALYRIGRTETLLVRGSLERIGLADGRFRAEGDGVSRVDRSLALPDHAAALTVLLDWLRAQFPAPLAAVGHRVVQGGLKLTEPCIITPEVLDTLRRLVPLAPEHLPGEIQAIEAIAQAYPELWQVACFDTAFHRTLPDCARRLALPRELHDEGIQRYGFHGISYQYIVEELRGTAASRLVIAHLGNGASIAAVRDGRGIDTTMGLTPLGGLVMGTRCGDLDPGVVLYLLREKGLGVAAADDLLNKHSGLLGVSGSSSDMQDLLGRAADDPRAAEAVELFCYQARKFIAAMAAAAGGLDTLVFTAGIGEHAAPIRARICAGLEFLAVQVDADRNAAHAPVISPEGAAVTVRVMKTNEELMIVRQTFALIHRGT